MEVFDTAAFLGYLKGMPREETFNYNNAFKCAVGQWVDTQLRPYNYRAGATDLMWWDTIDSGMRRIAIPAIVHEAMLEAGGFTQEDWTGPTNTYGRPFPIAWGKAHDALAARMQVAV